MRRWSAASPPWTGQEACRPPRRVLDLPRYAAMEEFFDRDGPWGRLMWRSGIRLRRYGVARELADAGFLMRSWWPDAAGQFGLSLSAPC